VNLGMMRVRTITMTVKGMKIMIAFLLRVTGVGGRTAPRTLYRLLRAFPGLGILVMNSSLSFTSYRVSMIPFTTSS
jgi:hypothetical protein